jgi:hypothetical protein
MTTNDLGSDPALVEAFHALGGDFLLPPNIETIAYRRKYLQLLVDAVNQAEMVRTGQAVLRLCPLTDSTTTLHLRPQVDTQNPNGPLSHEKTHKSQSAL